MCVAGAADFGRRIPVRIRVPTHEGGNDEDSGNRGAHCAQRAVMARVKHERFIVTGPGIADGDEPSYADPGPALSRALTAALAQKEEVTFYARDAITGEVIGYVEKVGPSWEVHRR